MKKQAGFTALEIIIIVVMVILIALAGWWVYSQTQDEAEPTESTTAEIENTDADNTPAVDQAEDLENVEQYLEDLNIEGDLDTSDLDNSLTY